ncbi:EscT/YscT/HrcT family type III secretion system export apparatus protein, partial [Enterococcus faecium]|nr:EscT/YscT/HrcT family type III secretion system export apparatus protein [Enterococcus faecium]MCZ1272241.1 EscT/YscT/HrcT family type III secretion system export apparatus protein [Enterococcus faecium]MCZ1368923.1 EscT/YscT/HrcT family type III secretion system export apparatus protein [Enterococcus faecium]MCZ1371859.1 EscT/YscT/HrcT family type III secretion system export apparatus protein [Enterococcus faecium]MCZ1400015.1 EscT/YscT/HrcT family type III secretion system export apparatus
VSGSGVSGVTGVSGSGVSGVTGVSGSGDITLPSPLAFPSVSFT